MLKKIVTLKILSLFLVSSLLAHGMDAPGPNGGNITMPGTFHVELKTIKNKEELLVYLLDIAFKNPTIIDSSVSIRINSNPIVACTAEKQYFKCPTPTLKTGDKVEIISTRSKVKGTLATYTFPFKY